MKYAFQLNSGMEEVELAGRQSQEKKKAAELRVDIKMRQVISEKSSRYKEEIILGGNSREEGRQDQGSQEKDD